MVARLSRKDWAVGATYGVVAVLLDQFSNIGDYRALGVTPWAPAAGVALAYAYVSGPKVWPFLFLAELFVLHASKLQLTTSWIFLVAAGTTLCWLGGAALLNAMEGFSARFRSTRTLLQLFLVALITALVQSLMYVGGLWVSGLASTSLLPSLYWRHAVGNVVGIIAVCPMLLLLHAGWRPPRLTWTHALQFVVLAGALLTIFSLKTASTYQLFYLLFLPLVWVGLRDGIGGAAVVLNIAQLGLVVGAQTRVDLIPSAGALQVLMVALAMTGLLVGAIVTEREQAARRLKDQAAAFGKAIKLRSAGETAAAIAHQINQPITAISTYAGVARDALAQGDLKLAGTAIDKLNEQCTRAASVVRSIRDLVKQGALDRGPLQLPKLLAELRLAHAVELDDLGIDFEIAISGSHPTILVDAVQLEQAIDNLVVNSIESISDTGKPGRIRVSCRQDASETHIDVEDSGPGFAPGLEDIATTPFLTTKRQGSGLGLAIARSVAEAHGGSLAVLNRQAGACVRLRLPTTGLPTTGLPTTGLPTTGLPTTGAGNG